MEYQKNIPAVMRILKHAASSTTAMADVAEAENPFHVLVSCIISLRTRDAVTAAASKRLFSLANTPQQLMQLRTAQIAKAIYPAGFYRVKATRIKEIARRIVTEFNGRVPADFDTLMTFKGVGRKTANIVMVYGFQKEGLPIDTHCHRIPNRLGWVATKTPDETEAVLRRILPKRYWSDFNELFVQFGQTTCTPLRPTCGACPVQRYCKYGSTKK